MTTPAGRVMFVPAHPDDADFLAGGTVARFVKEGRELTYVVLTNGNKGSADRTVTSDQIIAIREEEQRLAPGSSNDGTCRARLRVPARAGLPRLSRIGPGIRASQGF